MYLAYFYEYNQYLGYDFVIGSTYKIFCRNIFPYNFYGTDLAAKLGYLELNGWKTCFKVEEMQSFPTE